MSAESVDWFTPASAQAWAVNGPAVLTGYPPQPTGVEVLVEACDAEAVYQLDPTHLRVPQLPVPVPEPDRTVFDRQAARDVILERVRDGGPGDLDAFIVGVLRQVLDLDRPDSELAAKCRGIGDALTLLRALR